MKLDARSLRALGVAMYVASFATPTIGRDGWGVDVFIEVPRMAWERIARGEVVADWGAAMIEGCLTLAWMYNAFAFLRLSRRWSCAAAALPWITWAAMVAMTNVNAPPVDFTVMEFLPFYPWALGIGLIQCANCRGKMSRAACQDTRL